MKKKEIKKRIEELTGKLSHVREEMKTKFGLASSAYRLEGEIAGLEWVLKYWDKGYYEKV